MDDYLLLPDEWKAWTIEELIGSGSYGSVYRAFCEDPVSGRQDSAIKIIRIPGTESDAAALAYEYPLEEERKAYLENLVDGLLSEIRTMEKLRDNSNVVRLEDYMVVRDEASMQWTIYIRMELLTSLTDYLVMNEPAEEDIVKLGIDLSRALEECTEKGILHRDIKPENIMVDAQGNFKLGDFGVARQIGKTSGSLSLKGTFTYMAPEVYHGKKYDALADLYSLGIVMYRLLNQNRDPFIDPEQKLIYYKDREAALQKRMKGERLPLPSNASEALGRIVLKACAFEKTERYLNFPEMREALEGILYKDEDIDEGNAQISKQIIKADDGVIRITSKHRTIYSLWIVGVLTALLLDVVPALLRYHDLEHDIRFVIKYNAEFDVMNYFRLLPICGILMVLAYFVPVITAGFRETKIRFCIAFLYYVVIIFGYLKVTDIFRYDYHGKKKVEYAVVILSTIGLFIGFVTALIVRKSVIAQSIYAHTESYRNERLLLKKQKQRERRLKRAERLERAVSRNNDIYDKAVERAKAQSKKEK